MEIRRSETRRCDDLKASPGALVIDEREQPAQHNAISVRCETSSVLTVKRAKSHDIFSSQDASDKSFLLGYDAL